MNSSPIQKLPLLIGTALSLTPLLPTVMHAGSSTQVSEPIQETTAESYWQGTRALGDLGGLRSSLEDRGVSFFGSYEMNTAGNVSGGKKIGWAYADNFDFGLRLDLEKLFNWHGGTFVIQGINRDGKSTSSLYTGNFFQTQQLYGVQTFMFYGLYLDQKFWDDKVSLKIGRFAMSDDFANAPIYGLYMGNGINGSLKALYTSNGFSSYPGSVWAARIKVETSKDSSVTFGAFQANDRLYNEHNNGFDFRYLKNDGVTFALQAAWTPELFKRPVTTSNPSDGKGAAPEVEMKGLPGRYMIGTYLSLWDVPRFNSTKLSDKLYGFYLHAEQMIYQESPGSDEGLTVWSGLVYQPDEETQINPFYINGGLVYKGLLPGRSQDTTVLGLVHGRFSKDYAKQVLAAGGGKPTSESVLEFGYRFQVTKFAYIMPDVQYIFQPNGFRDADNALVLGLRAGVTF